MSWTTEKELHNQLNRLWERGKLLHALIKKDSEFPLRLLLKTPNSKELSMSFEKVRTWIAELKAISQIRIEWREVNHRVLGVQRVPESVWIDSLDAAFKLIGKRVEAQKFSKLLEITQAEQPQLVTWLEKRPLIALTLVDEWRLFLRLIAWIKDHPRPNIYLRQVNISGLSSKFIEAHHGVLSECLDYILPTSAVDFSQAGKLKFAARYGFLEKPIKIRFRVLDPSLKLLPGEICFPDLSLDATNFARLEIPVTHVFITENETNFLAFPFVANSIVIFGAGYGWAGLAKAHWLRHCSIYYWGDIDTHGFAILDQLRGYFEHVESFLMDRETLMAHETFWGSEGKPVQHDLPRLSDPEYILFNELRYNQIRKNLRLEQEMIDFKWVETALSKMRDHQEENDK